MAPSSGSARWVGRVEALANPRWGRSCATRRVFGTTHIQRGRETLAFANDRSVDVPPTELLPQLIPGHADNPPEDRCSQNAVALIVQHEAGREARPINPDQS